jgi:predicted nucleotidyltransferase
MNTQVQSVLAELRRQLEQLYGPRLIRLVLYGSQARGDAEPSSDIDVLVVLRDPIDPDQEIARSGEVVADLSLAHDVVLSCVFMGETEFLSRQGPLLRNIQREGVHV